MRPPHPLLMMQQQPKDPGPNNHRSRRIGPISALPSTLLRQTFLGKKIHRQPPHLRPTAKMKSNHWLLRQPTVLKKQRLWRTTVSMMMTHNRMGEHLPLPQMIKSVTDEVESIFLAYYTHSSSSIITQNRRPFATCAYIYLFGQNSDILYIPQVRI